MRKNGEIFRTSGNFRITVYEMATANYKTRVFRGTYGLNLIMFFDKIRVVYVIYLKRPNKLLGKLQITVLPGLFSRTGTTNNFPTFSTQSNDVYCC